MKNYAILTVVVPLPVTGVQPGQAIPVAVSLPNNATPLQVEYRPGVAGVQPSCAVHYLVPCDEQGNPIEEVITPCLYETAWNELYKLYGERLEQDSLDIMDSILIGVKLEIEDGQEVQREAEKG